MSVPYFVLQQNIDINCQVVDCVMGCSRFLSNPIIHSAYEIHQSEFVIIATIEKRADHSTGLAKKTDVNRCYVVFD